MATIYTRTFDLKEGLSDAEASAFWKLCINELLPACEALEGTRSIKLLSGAGALVADLSVVWEMDDASVYEKALHDADLDQHEADAKGAEIPEQRPYAWRKKQVNDFWNDLMKNLLFADYQKLEIPQEYRRRMGFVTLKRMGSVLDASMVQNDVFEIVDGQQRLVP